MHVRVIAYRSVTPVTTRAGPGTLIFYYLDPTTRIKYVLYIWNNWKDFTLPIPYGVCISFTWV